MRLTAAALGDLKLDGVTDRIIFDDDIPGFGIRVRASGAQTWIFQYKIGGRTRRLALGQVSAIKLAKARDIASELHAKVRLGGDPASEKKERIHRTLDTFGALSNRFLEQYRARPRTKNEVSRHLRKYAASLNTTPVDAITLRDVADLLAKVDKASGSVTANRVRATLSTVFSWAMKEGLALSNPIVNTNKREERARDRILSNDELRCIWNAAGDDAQAGASLHAYGTIVKLLILTGQRRSEIAEMRWSEVDLERCTLNLPAERTKNKRPHVVPLAPTALAPLAGRKGASERVFDFSAWAYSKDLLDKHSGVSDWVIHDLRRTAATGMADIGIQPHIIEAVLNHVSGHKGGVAGIYNRSSYAKEKAEALARWDEYVTLIVGGTR
ncbi:MAG: integrase arm-type DNA-binding domain-containing protein [Xanthobacteraceae bacterium]